MRKKLKLNSHTQVLLLYSVQLCLNVYGVSFKLNFTLENCDMMIESFHQDAFVDKFKFTLCP